MLGTCEVQMCHSQIAAALTLLTVGHPPETRGLWVVETALASTVRISERHQSNLGYGTSN